MQIYPFTVALFSYFIVASAFVAVRKGIKANTELKQGLLPPRQGDHFADRALSNQLRTVVVILFLLSFDRPRPIDFGYNGGGFSTVPSFLLGVGCYAVFAGAYKILLQILRMQDQQRVAGYLAHRNIWPRTPYKRRKLLTALIINPFTEELMYRGFLVYYLGNLLDSILLFCILGVAFCLTIHFYQGARMLAFHAGFCISSILILFSPLGIVGCFGLHVAADLYPLTEIRDQLQAWESARRRERLGAA